jgi:hypothetical protein
MSTSISFVDIAKVAHAAQQAYCKTIGELIPNWDVLTDKQQEAYIGFIAQMVSQPGASVEDFYDGDIPYTSLPRQKRVKDYLLFNTIGALLAN